MNSVYVLGHILIETIHFPDGRELGPVLGSPAAYTSVALARLGNKVCLCTKVGDDLPIGFHNVFRQAGVSVEGMVKSSKGSSRNRLIYRSMEDKEIEFLHKADPITFQDLPVPVDPSALYYVCPMDHEVPPKVVHEIVQRGGRVIADLGGYGGATSTSHPSGDRGQLAPLASVVAVCAAVKASLEDCRDLFGPTDASTPEHEYAEKLIELGSRLTVLTLGCRGAYVTDGRTEMHFEALPCTVRDTTGAGDAFSAGMIHAYRRAPSDWQGFVQSGQRTARWVLERSGGVAPERMPRAQDLEDPVMKEA